MGIYPKMRLTYLTSLKQEASTERKKSLRLGMQSLGNQSIKVPTEKMGNIHKNLELKVSPWYFISFFQIFNKEEEISTKFLWENKKITEV